MFHHFFGFRVPICNIFNSVEIYIIAIYYNIHLHIYRPISSQCTLSLLPEKRVEKGCIRNEWVNRWYNLLLPMINFRINLEVMGRVGAQRTERL